MATIGKKDRCGSLWIAGVKPKSCENGILDAYKYCNEQLECLKNKTEYKLKQKADKINE